MTDQSRETYYKRADALLAQAAEEWDALVKTITYELAVAERPKPTFSRIVDLRETSLESALIKLNKRNPFLFWREKMWTALRATQWASAYVNCYQGFIEVDNAENVGIYASKMTPRFQRVKSEMNALVDEMGKANVHKG